MTTMSAKQFFRIHADHAGLPDQWFLDEPFTATGMEIDAREFTEGLPYRGAPPASVPIFQPGREVAFHLAAFDMPVVSQAIADVVRRICPGDIECFPVEVPGSENRYSILNSICRLDCLDEAKSEFSRWQEKDNRPDRLGEFHVISVIHIDPARALDHHLFRLKDWPIALLVSGTLKDAIESIPNLGVVFESVV